MIGCGKIHTGSRVITQRGLRFPVIYCSLPDEQLHAQDCSCCRTTQPEIGPPTRTGKNLCPGSAGYERLLPRASFESVDRLVSVIKQVRPQSAAAVITLTLLKAVRVCAEDRSKPDLREWESDY